MARGAWVPGRPAGRLADCGGVRHASAPGAWPLTQSPNKKECAQAARSHKAPAGQLASHSSHAHPAPTEWPPRLLHGDCGKLGCLQHRHPLAGTLPLLPRRP